MTTVSAMPLSYTYARPGNARKAFSQSASSFSTHQSRPRWSSINPSAGEERVVISLSDQLAYLYRGSTLVAAASISTAKAPKITPTGIFTVLEKRPMYRSKKYDNAPMPFMQRIDDYGIAFHGGVNPGYPASHGCMRLPMKFAEKLYGVTRLGTKVVIEG